MASHLLSSNCYTTEYERTSQRFDCLSSLLTNMPQNIENYLRNLQTTDAVRADVWDAVYASDDPTVIEQRLRGVRGLSDTTKAKLWDLRFPTATASSTPAAASDPYGANLLTRAVGAGRGVIGGIGQGVMSTVLHVDDALRRAGAASGGREVARPLQDPQVQALITPYSTSAKVGKATEQIAEFAIPGGAAAKATKGAGLLGRAGAQAATAGAVGAAQKGDVNAGLVPAVVAGVMPVVGAVARKGAEALVRGRLPLNRKGLNTASPIADRFLKRDMDAQSVLDAGLTGTRRDVVRIAREVEKAKAKALPLDPAKYEAMLEDVAETLHRAPTSATLPGLSGIAGYLLGGLPGGLGTAAAMAAAQRYPLHTAQMLNQGSRVLQSGYAGGAVAAGAGQQLSPEAEAMLQALLERELAKEGGQ